jgi:hypothetical protein
VIAYGLERPTKDIDFLIDASPENVERVKRALAVLPDNAVRDVSADEVGRYEVVRVATQILQGRKCGWEYWRSIELPFSRLFVLKRITPEGG